MSDPSMFDPNISDASPASVTEEPTESFSDLLSQYERRHARTSESGSRQLEGIVVKVTSDSVLVDIGYKSEGILPLTAFLASEAVKAGDKLRVSVKGRDPEGYYTLSRFKVEQPKGWSALEQAFAEKTAIVGTVTGVVKGGLHVDVGVRAFMPASRSGARDTSEMEKLIGQEIRCRIIKLDVADEDIVVDRRALAEEEERLVKDRRYSELREGVTVQGTVRSLTSYGAFVDLGGVDALLHVGDIAWGRINQPSDVLEVGQEVEAKVLKISEEAGKRRIAIGMKQLLPHPWDGLAGKYKVGERARGTVTRLADFGAFVEIEPGIEGLIHVSEMSWVKKVKKPSDLLKTGDTVEAVILGVNTAERRISLGLKQTLGDPWVDVAEKFAAGSVVEGPVTSFTKFGAFVQITEGVEGMIHISEISSGQNVALKADQHYDEQRREPRINHPQDVLRIGQIIKTQVLAVDTVKRQLKLSMKQLLPSGIDEYVAEHKVGDIVNGRLVEVAKDSARVELGQGVHATCRIAVAKEAPVKEETGGAGKADLSSLTSMLNARWKGGAPSAAAKPEAPQAGQVRSFRIAKLDAAAKQIVLDLA